MRTSRSRSASILLLVLALTGADLEREMLGNATAFAIARWSAVGHVDRRALVDIAGQAAAQPEFEDAPADRLIAVELWDVRR